MSFNIPERRHSDWIKSIFLLIVVINFVIVDWPWFLLLLLFLEPAEAKEENKWSYSVVYTDNIALDNNRISTHEPNGIVENTHR